MALRMEAAERRETSCSPERPPKRMPTRSFFFWGFFVMDATSFYYFAVWTRKKVRRGIEVVFTGGFADFGVFCGGKSW
jgi:hypothetical protein